MKTDHNLIKDILPVYIKGETSADSNAIIEEHLNECEECRELYELLLSDDKLAQKPTPYDRFEASMKKVKRNIDLRMTAAVLLSLVAAVALFAVIFIGVVPANSTEVEITPEVYRIEDDGFGKEGIEIAFHLKMKDGRGCIDVRYDKSSPFSTNVYTVYNPAKIPFDDTSDSCDVYFWYGSDGEQTNIDTIRFHFRDKDVEYNLTDIVKDAGSI